MESLISAMGIMAGILGFLLFWYSLAYKERSLSRELLGDSRFGGEQW